MTKKNLNKRKKTRLAKKTLSPEEIQEKIQKRAYELYAKRGFAHGNDCADWLEAERLVKSSKY
ncbi:MAG: DUF2934 domain-containing protein [Candidatus Omnitrophica bacterium]|nr:DUF2934 domain-containing protein [Candidatus Omnitrophota bacterium]